MDKEEYAKQLDFLSRRICDSVASFTVWNSIVSDSKERMAALNQFKGFFKSVAVMARQYCLLTMASTFDTDSRAASFYNLLKATQESRTDLTPGLSDEDFAKIHAIFDMQEETIKKVREVRNKQIAHLDIDFSAAPDIAIDEYLVLLNGMQDLLNLFSSGFHRERWSFDWVAEQVQTDTTSIVDLVITHNKVIPNEST